MSKSIGHGSAFYTRLTPAGGMMLAMGVSGLLWSGVAIGMHLVGAF